MSMKFTLGTTAILFGSLVVAAPAPEQTVTQLDLHPKANHKLKDALHDAFFAENNLADLEPGKKTLDGVKFSVGEGFIQLANDNLKEKYPEKVEGIKVGAKFAKLHIFHGTGYSVPDDTVIGKYIIHYDDKSDAEIEIVFGKDVRDWWCKEGDKEPSRGKVAWKGTNSSAKDNSASLWLFHMTWENPKPEKKVVGIDYVSTLTRAAPFVIAMTTEDK
jgi:hypothetical protein